MQFDNRDHLMMEFSKEVKIRQSSFPIKSITENEGKFYILGTNFEFHLYVRHKKVVFAINDWLPLQPTLMLLDEPLKYFASEAELHIRITLNQS